MFPSAGSRARWVWKIGLVGVSAALLASGCGRSASEQGEIRSQAALTMVANGLVDPEGETVRRRFGTPAGFIRTVEAEGSFAAYLRDLPLKPHGSEVRLYDGRVKADREAYEAVVDLPIGRRDLHQCADAVIRLRAEYFFGRGQYERIHFDLTNGFRADYAEWMRGKRLAVSGNAVRWEQRAGTSNSRQDLWEYLELVFAYAGTRSLSRELRPVPVADLRIGDVFIVGGSPGHAVIVVDLAVAADGTNIFLLAQSFMPAQEIHILRNPSGGSINPWYHIPGEMLATPEWTFKSTDLKRFPD